MTTRERFEIPLDNQMSIFKRHLDDDLNERIIFSGIFGIGKSYFLEKFFEKNTDKYLAVNLAPINYSIFRRCWCFHQQLSLSYEALILSTTMACTSRDELSH